MTPERIEQERKAFEAWYSRAYLPTAAHGRTFSKYQAGTYRLQHVQDAWQTWQARAAQTEWISVKDRLPEIDESVLVCVGILINQAAFGRSLVWRLSREPEQKKETVQTLSRLLHLPLGWCRYLPRISGHIRNVRRLRRPCEA